jgi:hypothetical protein
MSEPPALEGDQILRALLEAHVDFVLIGGLAAQVHGSPSLTRDVDVCVNVDHENLDRLAVALRGLVAIRRGLPDGVAAPVDARALRPGDVFTLRTRFGDLDVLGHPEPGLDFQSLAPRSIKAELFGLSIRVASLEDLIATKRAAGRPKDRIELEILGALREELDRRD